MSLTAEFESLLFENKEDIPQGVYLKIMNELKKSHVKEQQKNNLFRIEFTTNKMHVEWNYALNEMEVMLPCDQGLKKKRSVIVSLSTEQYEHLNEHLPTPINFHPSTIQYSDRHNYITTDTLPIESTM